MDPSEAPQAEDGSDVGSGERAPVHRTGAQSRPLKPEKVGLPARPFLYTLDQIAALLNLSERTIAQSYIHYQNYTFGPAPRGKMLAHNVSREGSVSEHATHKNDWRVSEQEFVRWMRYKGFTFYERAWPTN